MATVLLVRHTAVALRWKGVCYGASDAGLSRDGMRHARLLAAELADHRPAAIIHSGLRRTRILAALIAGHCALDPVSDPRWQERHFGHWEGRRWQAIWRESGSAMDRMLTEPEDFRPGGGETGADLAQRVQAAWASLPSDGTMIVISHGGPIGTLLTLRAARNLSETLNFVPLLGSVTRLAR